MLTKRVENIVGKGEIAHNEQFLLFPQCFPKVCYPGASKGVIVWEWINDPEKKPIENIVGKGENADGVHFLLFSQCFLPISKRVSVFKLHLFCHMQRLSFWTSLKICLMVKG